MTSIYVGNLAHSATEDDLRQAFSQHGEVTDVNIVKDRQTGASRGFAFVEMPNSDEAAKAIEGLNLHQIGGRSITVDQARPKKSGGPRRGGGLRRRW
jgi:RNA recognition motif-containing protein